LTNELLYSGMKPVKLKAYLNQIADGLTEDSTLEDVYEQLSLLADIEESEEQVEKGEILTQKEVEENLNISRSGNLLG
jgi:predicted transcriptional regulator